VKLVGNEPDKSWLEGFVAGRGERVASALTRIESTRALRRASFAFEFEFEPILAETFRTIDFMPIDERIVALASRVEPPLLRSLDAIHLASALTLGSELEALVTYDRRLAEAAGQLGIPVFPETMGAHG
jgi:uncharacterized protein